NDVAGPVRLSAAIASYSHIRRLLVEVWACLDAAQVLAAIGEPCCLAATSRNVAPRGLRNLNGKLAGCDELYHSRPHAHQLRDVVERGHIGEQNSRRPNNPWSRRGRDARHRREHP